MFKWFSDYGFNLKKDIKRIGLSKKDTSIIFKELLNDLYLKKGVLLHATKDFSMQIFKIREKNPLNPKSGKSGGIRVILLHIKEENKYIAFHMYSKKHKQNITDVEDNKIKEILGIN